jgi:hypothetical protein
MAGKMMRKPAAKPYHVVLAILMAATALASSSSSRSGHSYYDSFVLWNPAPRYLFVTASGDTSTTATLDELKQKRRNARLHQGRRHEPHGDQQQQYDNASSSSQQYFSVCTIKYLRQNVCVF